MKFFSPTALLAAALLSVLAALPFLPAAKMRPDLFSLEVRLVTTAAGPIQIFFDDGTGLSEERSGRFAATAGSAPQTHRIALPPGTYTALRVDPLDRGATTVLLGLRALSPTGRVIEEIPLDGFAAANQIQTLSATATRLEVVSAANSDDPQIATRLARPLRVHASSTDYLRGSAPYILPIFAALALGLLVLDRASGLRRALAAGGSALAARPRRALAAVAALAVVVSAYPVVFLGKSFVSPNLGTILLYDDYPTLPGYKSSEVTDVKLSDVGAVMWQHVPFSMMQHRALRQGELPLWNRYNALGVPLLAQGQSMFGDPLHLFVVAADGAAWAWDVKYLVAKWLFALGLALLVYTLCAAPPAPAGFNPTPSAPTAAAGPPLLAAALVALAAPFIGFFLYRVNHPAFFSLCYAPWPLYCLVRVSQAATRRAVDLWALALVVANLALMNSGTVKEAYMLLVCMNLSGGCIVLAAGGTWRERLAKLGTLAWFGLLFVLLTAPIWGAFLDTLKNAYTGYNAVSAYQIQPTLLLGAFDEIFYRPLMAKDQVFSPSLNFLLLGGFLFFLATLRVHFSRPAVIALAASSLLPLSLAFGLVSPLWIVRLPFLGNIAHLDNTFSCALLVLWSVLAGVGFAAAARRLGTPEGRGDLVVAGLLLFGLVFAWIAFRQAAHRPIYGPIFTVHQPGQVLQIHPFIWDYLAALLVALVVLAVAARGAALRGVCSPARGLLLAACVSVLLWRHGLHASAAGFETFTSRPTDRVRFHAKSEAMQLVRAAHAKDPARGFGLHGNFFPGWTGVYGLETVHGPDALVNPWLRDLMTVSGVERMWDWRLYADASTVGAARPFFDALNVRYYLDYRSDQGALGRALTLVKPADLDVYTSPTAWPRAFFTDTVASYGQLGDLVRWFRDSAGRPLAAFEAGDTVARTAVEKLPRDLAARTHFPASAYRLTANSTSFNVRANGPGVAVLTEAFWPGDFRAELNGRAVPVLRLNHAFKGVLIDSAGDHRVTFTYRPRFWPRYVTLCALGAALLAFTLVLHFRRVRVPAAPAGPA